MLDWRAYLPAIYLISEWVIRIGMTPIVVRERRSSNALAWLAAIYFIPWIGFIFYVLIGERRLGRRRRERYAEARRRVETPARMALQEPHVVHPTVPPEQDDLVLLCERLGGLPIVGGNTVEFITETTGFIDALIADVERSERHVHLHLFSRTTRREHAWRTRSARRRSAA